ncbi:DUF6807 domain-containing protein [Nocardiopsis chromatogenes]|uniref:DUF6807 domain-containing protein n=1 Tax=Nocardiopsis chromatogenes TaxID=280239 RepID=UPI00034619B3|nr:PmoA family protein [Nocardiopsis chromatogenes]
MYEQPKAVRDGDALSVTAGGTEIARYVLDPAAPAEEAPKPHLHPLRTLDGAPVTAVRPWDHRWHKGLQMTWSHVSGENFWGGPTYVHGRGYVWLDNLGTIAHERFEGLGGDGGGGAFTEHLSWTASTGRRWIEEVRTHRFHGVDAHRGTWALDFATSLTNVRGATLELGSPTTHGRPAAGYTGLFWRGPRAWTGCAVHSASGHGGDAVMGTRSEWIAFAGRHDEIDGGATVLAFAGTTSGAIPITWFARSEAFPAFCPSPAFDEPLFLDPGESLELWHRVVVADWECTAEQARELAQEYAP